MIEKGNYSSAFVFIILSVILSILGLIFGVQFYKIFWLIIMSLNHEPIEIKEIDVGLRLDKFLKIKFRDLNYLNIQKLIRTGQIRINGKRVDGSKRLN